MKNKSGKSKKAFQSKLSPNKRTTLFHSLLILILTLLLYGNSTRNLYNIDDHLVIHQNPLVQQGIQAIPRIFTSLYAYEADFSYGYRPLVQSTYAIEFQLFGINPKISHWINLLIYLLTGFALYKTLRLLFSKYRSEFHLLITLLFLAHPIHTEVVASLKNRDELMSFLFSILALNYLFRYVTQGKTKLLIYGGLLFLLGMLSKISALSFLAIFPLVFYFFTDTPTKKILWVVGTMASVFLIGYVYRILFIPNAHRTMMFFENPLVYEESFWVRTATAMVSLLFYIRLLVFPHPLSFYYGYDTIPLVNWSSPWALLALLIYLGGLILALRLIKKKHLVSFAILYFLITIAMFSNLVKPAPGIVAERFAYAASLGFVLLLVWGLYKLFKIDPASNEKRKTPLLLILSVVVLLIPATIKTFKRNQNWRSKYSLITHDIQHLENSAKAQVLCASTRMERIRPNPQDPRAKQLTFSNVTAAIGHLQKAIELYPDYYKALNNLGSIYSAYLHEYEEAIHYFDLSIEANPFENEQPWYNKAYAFEQLGNIEKATENYQKALDINPNNMDVITSFAQMKFAQGNLREAINLNKKIMLINPATDLPYINIGNFYMQLQDTTQAIHYWELAVRKVPQYRLAKTLSAHFQAHGDKQKALYYSRLGYAARTNKY